MVCLHISMQTVMSIFFVTLLVTPHIGNALPPPEGTYNICILLSFVTPSHRNPFVTIAKELLDRGHQVTVLSSLPPVLNHPNATEITHTVAFPTTEQINMFEIAENEGLVSFDHLAQTLSTLARELYKEESVLNLYNRRDEFDLFLTDVALNDQTYPFLDGKPFILVSTAGKFPTIFNIQGNPLNPSYVPALTDWPRPWTMLNRIQSWAETLIFPYLWHLKVTQKIQYEISLQFPDLPPLKEIEKQVSVLFTNSHFSLDFAAPVLPSQVEIGAIHCRPQQPLPSDISKWIEGSGNDGVLYFSLGSITRGNTMPIQYRDMFIQAFAKLKQRVIWKFEDEMLNISSNVMLKKWLPQQDILADPRVKIFITHGGLMGFQEAIYHSTAMITLPIYGDQPRNCKHVANREYGICLSWKTLTVDLIVDSIQEIIKNPKYKKNVKFSSSLLRDQPLSPKDNAVWWAEYVIRSEGAPQLRSPAADISWIQFLMLDVILLIHFIMFTTFWMFKKTCKKLLFSSTPKKKKE